MGQKQVGDGIATSELASGTSKKTMIADGSGIDFVDLVTCGLCYIGRNVHNLSKIPSSMGSIADSNITINVTISGSPDDSA